MTNATASTATERAYAQIRDRIASGVFPTGSVLPTERDLSLSLGISRPIIRAALAGISEAGWITREHGRRPRVAFRPDSSDAAAGSEPQVAPVLKTIAAILPMEPDYPAAYNIVRGIQRTLQRLDSRHRLIVFDTLLGVRCQSRDSARAAREHEILEAVLSEGIAGAIFWHSGGHENIDKLEELSNRGVPIVFVDRCLEDLPCNFVGVDNRGGAREAVSHLIELGHRNIVHLTTFGHGNEGTSQSVRERYEGYLDALEDHGIPIDEDLIIGTTGEAVKRVRSTELPAATAVFTVNDATAHAFLEMASAEGLRVPDDVSVVGFDDLDRYARRAPFLTTMRIPFEAIGERAGETLLQCLAAEASRSGVIQHTILSTRLIARGSARPFMKGDEIR